MTVRLYDKTGSIITAVVKSVTVDQLRCRIYLEGIENDNFLIPKTIYLQSMSDALDAEAKINRNRKGIVDLREFY